MGDGEGAGVPHHRLTPRSSPRAPQSRQWPGAQSCANQRERYRDEEESDVFILAGAKDLVPVLGADVQRLTKTITVQATRYQVRTYRPRIEGLSALIERRVQVGAPENMFWRTILAYRS